MSGHSVASLGARHPIHNWEYANTAARTGASGFVAADVGKVAKQTDDNTYWVLTVTTPTWTQINSAGGGTDANAIHVATPAEISAITEKTTPLAADMYVCESAADSDAKRRTTLANMLKGAGDALVAETILGSDGTTISLSSLDGDAHGIYQFMFAAEVDGNTFSMTLEPNGAATGCASQMLMNYTSTQTLHTEFRIHALSTGTAAPCIVRGSGLFYAKRTFGSGTARHRGIICNLTSHFAASTYTDDRQSSGTWQNTADNLTSLDLVSTVNFLAGSWFGIRKVAGFTY